MDVFKIINMDAANKYTLQLLQTVSVNGIEYILENLKKKRISSSTKEILSKLFQLFEGDSTGWRYSSELLSIMRDNYLYNNGYLSEDSKTKAIYILNKIKENIEYQEKIFISSVSERLEELGVNSEEVNAFQNQIYFQRIVQEKEFLPEFKKILIQLGIVQWSIQHSKSTVLLFTTLSKEQFWNKMKKDINEVDFTSSLPSYEIIERLIKCIYNCEAREDPNFNLV